MVFALDKDDGGLLALPSAAAAAAHCKAVDVEDGFWRFFADDGSPLEARLERADVPGDEGVVPAAYTLQRAMSGLWLQERLDQVTSVRGCGLTTVAELVETLKRNRGKRVEAGGHMAPGSVSQQKNIAARFGALFVPVDGSEKAGVALETLASAPLNALRHPPENGTSGWYIWGGEKLSDEPTFFKPLHHSHLAQHCPDLVPYLGLGPGWRVLLAPNQEEVWFDEKLLVKS